MLKRLFSIFTISLVLTGSFFSVYNIKYPVYADSSSDDWTQVTTNDQLVEAFRYYCKSRDLTIEGSVADAVTSFTTSTFNGLCNTLGIDITALQAQIKYQTDGNLGTRFLFTSLGIDAYNRIFAQFLQDNNLSVGDTVNDLTVADGPLYEGQFCYVFNSPNRGEIPSKYGSAILGYVGSDFLTLYDSGVTSITLPVFGSTRTYNLVKNVSSGNTTMYINEVVWPSYALYYSRSTYNGRFAYVIFTNSSYSNNIYLCNVSYQGSYGYYAYTRESVTKNTAQNYYPNVTVTITTNNNVINNNTYEGDTVINNNGDTNTYPDTPDIPDPNPNPTPDPPTIPDSGGWQDFSLPDMPNDWLIYGMEKKFPFDIPFNIMFALSLLNHEPEIPKFEGDIDLQVCTWHYDIDLTPFDDIATILRKFEVLAFIIGLAILTKNLINWG